MHSINKKIDGKIVVGQVKFNGKLYYVCVDKSIYVEKDSQYEIVQDKEILQNLLEYISPTSIDVKLRGNNGI